MLSLGFNVSQVVHAYGDICQAITELALEQQTPIDTQEFRILNHCLDMAIAEAVTEHARVTNEKTGARGGAVRADRSRTRNLLSTALLAFQTVKQGAVSIDGSTPGWCSVDP